MFLPRYPCGQVLAHTVFCSSQGTGFKLRVFILCNTSLAIFSHFNSTLPEHWFRAMNPSGYHQHLHTKQNYLDKQHEGLAKGTKPVYTAKDAGKPCKKMTVVTGMDCFMPHPQRAAKWPGRAVSWHQLANEESPKKGWSKLNIPLVLRRMKIQSSCFNR